MRPEEQTKTHHKPQETTMKTITLKTLSHALNRLPVFVAVAGLTLAFAGLAKADAPFLIGTLGFNISGANPGATITTSSFTLSNPNTINGPSSLTPTGIFAAPTNVGTETLTFLPAGSPATFTGLSTTATAELNVPFLQFALGSDTLTFDVTSIIETVTAGTATFNMAGVLTDNHSDFSTSPASVVIQGAVGSPVTFSGSLASAPEPSSWLMALLVLGTLGYLLRSRIVRSAGLDLDVDDARLAV
jgi:hypothetical protein